jgi:formylglycine-generating enzyme required for sulfatase activity
LADFAVMASQWLSEGVPEDPNSLFWIYIDDPGVEGHEGFVGEMSKYETTNAQYCTFLNEALASGDITVSDGCVYGADGSNSGADYVGELYFKTYDTQAESQIVYSGGTFSVRSRDGHDMSDHPVVHVNWYGADAFCHYYGYRLPTEWEWQAAADYDGSFIYGCGITIDQTKANYWDVPGYANPLGLSEFPYTSPADYYPSYGYRLKDMAGNVWEWTSSVLDPAYSYLVLRGGCWSTNFLSCEVAFRSYELPYSTYHSIGFRVCR